MKIIELLNKIANNDLDTPDYIEFFDRETSKANKMMVCEKNIIYYMDRDALFLNDEVEIIEEPQEHKIPEKLGYQDNADGTFYLNHKKYNSEPIKMLSKKMNEIINYLDYLKSKGDE